MNEHAPHARESYFATLLHVARELFVILVKAAFASALFICVLAVMTVATIALLPRELAGSALFLNFFLLICGIGLFIARRHEVEQA